MISNKKEFGTGLVMLVGFFVVLILMFQPIFKGHNGLEFFDNLFNSISKGSAYYIPDQLEKSKKFDGKVVDLTMNFSVKSTDKEGKEVDKSAEFAAQAAKQLTAVGAQASATDKGLKLNGDMGKIFAAILRDCDAMYANKGEEVSKRYNGDDYKKVMKCWWETLKVTQRALLKQEMFPEASQCDSISKRAVEASYNFYSIKDEKIGNKVGLVVGCLTFYVFYTLWYGFAIMFLFEGWGMKIGH